MAINRFHREPLNTSAETDARFSSLDGLTGIAVNVISDDQGNNGVEIWNFTGSAIDPDTVATYDQAPNGKSLFYDLAGGKIYYKSADTTWTVLLS